LTLLCQIVSPLDLFIEFITIIVNLLLLLFVFRQLYGGYKYFNDDDINLIISTNFDDDGGRV